MQATTIDAPHGIAPDGPTAHVADPLEQAYEVLSAARWGVEAFAAWAPWVRGHAGDLTPYRRTDWIIGLRALWDGDGRALPPAAVQAVFDLAAAWDDWPLAIVAGERLAALGRLGALDHAVLCRAYVHTGRAEAAWEQYTLAMLARPHDPLPHRDHALAASWWEFCARFPFFQTDLTTDGELSLELLGEHHLRDFAWQYHDPAVAERCCLPDFEDDDDWRHWLRESYSEEDALVFAVLHREWGFIGSVSIALHGDVGFFYYWLGPDFQGHGFGPRAAALLLELVASCFGMRACYAKVFADNAASRRGLAKLGFEDLDLTVATPFGDERIYRLGPQEPRAAVLEETCALLERTGCDVPPVLWCRAAWAAGGAAA